MLKALYSPRGMVTAPHHLASQAGLAVLRDGGNAVDAMVANGCSHAWVDNGGDTSMVLNEPVLIDIFSEPGAKTALAIELGPTDGITSTSRAYRHRRRPPAEEFDSDARNGIEETLSDYLMWQLNLTPMSDRDRTIATSIIDSIDADGMLSVADSEILTGLDPDLEVGEDEYLAVLKRIQQFDPPGIAARDLRECLGIQLRQLPDDGPWVREARHLVAEHLDLLAGQDLALLKRRLKLDDDSLREVVHLIQSLNPRPGAGIGTSDTEYVIPDVMVRKQGNNQRKHKVSRAFGRVLPETPSAPRVPHSFRNRDGAAVFSRCRNRGASVRRP